MLKITYYNRDKRTGNFSIEELFTNLKSALTNRIEIKDYFSSGKRWKDLFSASTQQGNINHITGDVNHLAIALDGNKTILTVHDVGHYEVTLKGLKKLIYKLIWMEIPYRKVKYITAISEFTKSRILKHVNIDPNKIKVIYNPAPAHFTYHPKDFNVQKPLILQIGSGSNKNAERLVEAVRGIPCKLLLINCLNEKLKKALDDSGIEYESCASLTKEEVYSKYKECDLVFFASTYEGFGMPIIEANAIGRPVITSNTASMPEIASDAACIVNPFNVSDIRSGIQKIIANKAYREELIQNGLNNVKRFDINIIADQYLELYKSTVQK